MTTNNTTATTIRTAFALFGADYRAGEARYRNPRGRERCARCGRPLTGRRIHFVHYLTTGEITNVFADAVADSQGLFGIGPECAKGLPAGFTIVREVGE